jgi:hypothetical protein
MIARRGCASGSAALRKPVLKENNRLAQAKAIFVIAGQEDAESSRPGRSRRSTGVTFAVFNLFGRLRFLSASDRRGGQAQGEASPVRLNPRQGREPKVAKK